MHSKRLPEQEKHKHVTPRHFTSIYLCFVRGCANNNTRHCAICIVCYYWLTGIKSPPLAPTPWRQCPHSQKVTFVSPAENFALIVWHEIMQNCASNYQILLEELTTPQTPQSSRKRKAPSPYPNPITLIGASTIAPSALHPILAVTFVYKTRRLSLPRVLGRYGARGQVYT